LAFEFKEKQSNTGEHMRDAIELARKAGGDDWGLFKDFMPEIERLVALVRADAIADEREACARIVEESSLPDSYSEACLPEIAAFIRARGENT
jgi:hypothetical protein